MITATAAGCAAAPIVAKLSKDAFTMSPFIRRSQRADLVYLTRLRDGKYTDLGCDRFLSTGYVPGGGTSPASPIRVWNPATQDWDISYTTPPTSSLPFSTLCNPRDSAKHTKISTEYEVSKPKDATEQSKLCDTTEQAWWESLGRCVDDEVLAVASDETDGKLVRNDGIIFSHSGGSTNLDYTIGKNMYLAYSRPAGVTDWGWLSGKRVEISLDGAINPPTSSTILKTVFDGGTTPRVWLNNVPKWKCNWLPSPSYCSNSEINFSADNKTITITIPTSVTPSQFVVGNHMTFLSTYFIDRKVKKIRILRP